MSPQSSPAWLHPSTNVSMRSLCQIDRPHHSGRPKVDFGQAYRKDGTKAWSRLMLIASSHERSGRLAKSVRVTFAQCRPSCSVLFLGRSWHHVKCSITPILPAPNLNRINLDKKVELHGVGAEPCTVSYAVPDVSLVVSKTKILLVPYHLPGDCPGSCVRRT